MNPKKTEPETKTTIPDGLWTKCPKCEQIIYNKELKNNLKICPKCSYYFRMSARERIELLLEPKSLKEKNGNLAADDLLHFIDTMPYKDRLKENVKKTGLKEAVIIGEGNIGSYRVVVGVLDFDFMGGSMGRVVGEKITRAVEWAIKVKTPLVIISSSGGARMQEGIFSLMQMAKTSAALAKLKEAGVPYIAVLTDPTTGGVTASFGMLGDITIAEPHSLIAFAGPRVIEQTIRQKLPEGFQQSEFLQKHGMVDMVVSRHELKNTLIRILSLFNK